jgi:ABC-type nitrate/sulfonate/bicarbonate transport system substrate-binding protein
MAGLKLTIEPVAPFNGLDVLVALEEGLFAEEGLDLTIAPRETSPATATEYGSIDAPHTAQGSLLETGRAQMFQA